MTSSLIQIIALYLFYLIISYKISNNKIYIIASLIVALLIMVEAASVFLTGNLIDYRAYSHMNIREIIDWAPLFKIEILLFILAYCLLLFSTYLITKQLRKKLILKNHVTATILFILIAIMSSPSGLGSESYKIYEILTVSSESFEDALSNLGISAESYVRPQQVKATKGKNIIVISLESIEQGYISSDFKEITPNLTRLSKELTYYSNFPESPGSKWTSASLYTHQVGMPAFFKGSGNEFFQNSSEVKLTGLGHILNKAGYKTTYFMGNPESAGIKDILTAYTIDIMSEDSFDGKYPDYGWGLHDYDLFNEAKVALKELKNKKEPFAFFMSTVSTHFPKGIYDIRMKEFVPERNDSLEFSVASLDYMLGDFINFLKDEKILDNTAIFIFPDHLLMGNKNKVLNKLKKNPRQLFLLTNITEEKPPKKTHEKLYQIDLPRMILDGSEVKTNAKFLTDYISTDDTISYLNANRAKLTVLNTASLKRTNFINGLSITNNSHSITISSTETEIDIKLQENSESNAVKLLFNEDMVFIRERSAPIANLLRFNNKEQKYIQLVIKKDKNKLLAHLKSMDKTWLTKSGINNIHFSKDEIKKILRPEKTISHLKVDQLIAHAGGEIEGAKYTDSLEALNLSYKNGFRLLELDIIKTSDNIYVAAHDWKHWAHEANYKGATPPTRDEFKKYKIRGRYTSIDIDDINKWFIDHPDAILVTDKTNDPIDFSDKFVDKDRLMMELFSLDAVKKGIKAKIKSAMPSWSVISQLKGDKLKIILNLGITDIAASRNIIKSNKSLLKDLKRHGINIYAFHVNFEKGKDEQYVFCNESDYIHGIYADVWNFDVPTICN